MNDDPETRRSGDRSASFVLRTTLRASDVPAIVRFHRAQYEHDFGFDPTFEAHVAGPLDEFARGPTSRERVWIVEDAEGSMIGCIAIVEARRSDPGDDAAQLRWFLVERAVRGTGLGRRLLNEAIEFSRGAGYTRLVLWTVDALEPAAALYRSAGFVRVLSTPARLWGADLAEEKYELRLEGGA